MSPARVGAGVRTSVQGAPRRWWACLEALRVRRGHEEGIEQCGADECHQIISVVVREAEEHALGTPHALCHEHSHIRRVVPRAAAARHVSGGLCGMVRGRGAVYDGSVMREADGETCTFAALWNVPIGLRRPSAR